MRTGVFWATAARGGGVTVTQGMRAGEPLGRPLWHRECGLQVGRADDGRSQRRLGNGSRTGGRALEPLDSAPLCAKDGRALCRDSSPARPTIRPYAYDRTVVAEASLACRLT
jgi:hypothetical protein